MGPKSRPKPGRPARAQPQVSPLAAQRLPLTSRDWMVAAALVLLTFDAKQANDIITKAFHMPPGPDNIDMVIRQAAAQ